MRIYIHKFTSFILFIPIIFTFLSFFLSSDTICYMEDQNTLENGSDPKKMDTNLSKFLFISSTSLILFLIHNHMGFDQFICGAKLIALLINFLYPPASPITSAILIMPIVDLNIPIIEIVSLVILLPPTTPQQIEFVRIIKNILTDLAEEIIEKKQNSQNLTMKTIMDKFLEQCEDLNVNEMSNTEVKACLKYAWAWFLRTDIFRKLNKHLKNIKETEAALSKLAEDFKIDSDQ